MNILSGRTEKSLTQSRKARKEKSLELFNFANIDELVKNRILRFVVIPAKAGIQ